MSARDLRAEARAWRRAAERADGRVEAIGPIGEATISEDAMYRRADAHYKAAMDRMWYWDPDSVVLACLFLALECEDEARALRRGGR